MNTLLYHVRMYVADTWSAFWQGWSRFWFTPSDPTTLAVIRIITGLVLLYVHLTTLPYVSQYIGPNAWLDQTAVDSLLEIPENPDDPESPRAATGAFSIWYYVKQPTAVYGLYAVFLTGCFCFTLGLFSRVASVVVWIGHVSYVQRATNIFFGMDSILALLTLYLMFGPTGATLSADSWLARRRNGDDKHAPNDEPKPKKYVTANLVCRLLQVHMCIIYLSAGCAKLMGNQWWEGLAIYATLTVPEFALVDMTWIGRYDWLWIPISNFGVAFTIWTELGFAFLIWHRRMKPIMLTSAILLQIGIGLFMGLGAFQAAMFAGCLAFISPESMRWFIDVLLHRKAGVQIPQSGAGPHSKHEARSSKSEPIPKS